jgi:hypothetical protein
MPTHIPSCGARPLPVNHLMKSALFRYRYLGRAIFSAKGARSAAEVDKIGLR